MNPGTIAGVEAAALYGGSGLLLAGSALAIALVLKAAPEPVPARVRDSVRAKPKSKEGTTTAQRGTKSARALLRRVGRKLERRGWGQGLDGFLDRAALQIRPGEYIATVAGLTALVFAVCTVAGLGAISFMLAAAIGPVLHIGIRRRGKKRTQAFHDQLASTLSMMAGSARAGHGLMQSVKTVASKTSEPTASELRRVVAETRVGRNPLEALSGMADRLQSDDFAWAVRGIELNRELGGNLAELLENLADTIRERNQLADQVRVLSTEGKFSATVLLCLPFVVVLVLSVLNPEYIGLLYSSNAGLGITGGALTLMVTGALWIRSMIQIEY